MTPVAGLRRVAHLAPACLLLLFLSKPFHIDDNLFLTYARIIGREPLNPFHGTLVFEGRTTNLFTSPNPLLWPYALSLVRKGFGESEVALHLLTLAFALLALDGLARLATRLQVSPLVSCWLFGGCGAFLAMGSSVMPDVPLAGCALAAAARLVRGVDEGRPGDLVAAGLLAGTAYLFRYSALFFVALFPLYPYLRRRLSWKVLLPLASVFILPLAYEAWTFALMGKPHLLRAVEVGTQAQAAPRLLQFTVAELVQLGAQLPALAAIAASALAVRGRWLSGAAACLSLALGLSQPRGPVTLAALAFPAVIVVIEALRKVLHPALLPFRKRGGEEPGLALRLFLSAWVLLTLFVTVRYIHVAAKYVLLPLPAAILLIQDRLNLLGGARRMAGRYALAISTAVSVGLGVAVAWSDYRWAGGYRDFFANEYPRLRAEPGGVNYMAAEWGFRYYGEIAGLTVYRGEPLHPRDRLFIPITIAAPEAPPSGIVPIAAVPLVYLGPFAILNRERGAGFYSNAWGPYPFVPAGVVADTVVVLAFRPGGGP